MKQQKGITLIALVITIIVLLILAGVTIAMLTGTDSAPVKANEAKQKQDIGSAKDQVYLYAQDYQTDAYDRIYVQGKGFGTDSQSNSSDAKSKDVGDYVGGELSKEANVAKFDTVGLAHITVSSTKGDWAGTIKTEDQADKNGPTAYVTIYTTDFITYGYVQKTGGTLVWDSVIKTK